MSDALISPSPEHLQKARALLLDMPEDASLEDLQATVAAGLAEFEQEVRASARSNQAPVAIDPERLVDVDALPELLAANYGPLINRGTLLEGGVSRWLAKHLVPRPEDWPEGKTWPVRYAIPDDADNDKTADFLRMLAVYAGGRTADSGEVDEARRKVKRPLFDGGKMVDAWFNNLRQAIREGGEIMDQAQTAFLRAKAAAEQQRRNEEAAAAELEARRMRDEAVAAGGTDEAVDAALAAEQHAEEAAAAAEAPRPAQVRSTSAAGTTTTLRANWKFKLDDLVKLVKAVAAGDVPVNFLTTNDSVITATIKAEKGTKPYAGLTVFDDARAARSGRTGA